MAKKKESKPRADKYDEKVKFEGTLEQMIAIAVKPIHGKKKDSEENCGVRGG